MTSIPGFNAIRGYADAASAIRERQPASPSAPNADHGAAFRAAHALQGSIGAAESAAAEFMTTGADPHSVIEALAAAELAVETAVTIRNKVVEAYQELLRMPV